MGLFSSLFSGKDDSGRTKRFESEGIPYNMIVTHLQEGENMFTRIVRLIKHRANAKPMEVVKNQTIAVIIND